jgi:hypothetical protein
MGARFYQPANDTFTSRDTTDGTLSSPLSLNRYTYANDNPISNLDLDGHHADPLDPNAARYMRQVGVDLDTYRNQQRFYFTIAMRAQTTYSDDQISYLWAVHDRDVVEPAIHRLIAYATDLYKSKAWERFFRASFAQSVGAGGFAGGDNSTGRANGPCRGADRLACTLRQISKHIDEVASSLIDPVDSPAFTKGGLLGVCGGVSAVFGSFGLPSLPINVVDLLGLSALEGNICVYDSGSQLLVTQTAMHGSGAGGSVGGSIGAVWTNIPGGAKGFSSAEVRKAITGPTLCVGGSATVEPLGGAAEACLSTDTVVNVGSLLDLNPLQLPLNGFFSAYAGVAAGLGTPEAHGVSGSVSLAAAVSHHRLKAGTTLPEAVMAVVKQELCSFPGMSMLPFC